MVAVCVLFTVRPIAPVLGVTVPTERDAASPVRARVRSCRAIPVRSVGLPTERDHDGVVRADGALRQRSR